MEEEIFIAVKGNEVIRLEIKETVPDIQIMIIDNKGEPPHGAIHIG